MLTRRVVLAALAAAPIAWATPAEADALGRPPVQASILWPPPAHPLDQGQRPTCGYFASMQQLNMVGAHITQHVADQVSDDAQARTVSLTRSADDNLQAALRRHGIPARYEKLPAGPTAALAATRTGPVVADVAFYAGMYDTTIDGRWRPTGTPTWLSHGIVVRGVDRAGRVWVLNQWGAWWGSGGSAWLTRHDFNTIMTGVSATRWRLAR